MGCLPAAGLLINRHKTAVSTTNARPSASLGTGGFSFSGLFPE
jgi:hypothetical protein